MFLKQVNTIFAICKNDRNHFEILPLNVAVNKHLWLRLCKLHNIDIYYYSDILQVCNIAVEIIKLLELFMSAVVICEMLLHLSFLLMFCD